MVSIEMCSPRMFVPVRFRDRPDRHLPHLRPAAHDDDALAEYLFEVIHKLDILHHAEGA